MENKYKTKKLSLREIFDDLTDEEFDELMKQWDEEVFGKPRQSRPKPPTHEGLPPTPDMV